MDYKIIQIIPVTKPMYARYRNVERDEVVPIFCLALIEYTDGERAIKAMDSTVDNEFDFPETASNFVEIFY